MASNQGASHSTLQWKAHANASITGAQAPLTHHSHVGLTPRHQRRVSVVQKMAQIDQQASA
jgi:hypothetical protein